MKCNFCKAEIPWDAKRCMFCTADFEAEAQKEANREEARERERERLNAENTARILLDRIEYDLEQQQLARQTMQAEQKNLEIVKKWTPDFCNSQLDIYLDFLNSPEAIIPTLGPSGWISNSQRPQWGFWNYFGDIRHFHGYKVTAQKHFETEWLKYVETQAHPSIREKWREVAITQEKRKSHLKIAMQLIDEFWEEEQLLAKKWEKVKDVYEAIVVFGAVLSAVIGLFFREYPIWIIPLLTSLGALVARIPSKRKMDEHLEKSRRLHGWWRNR